MLALGRYCKPEEIAAFLASHYWRIH